MDYTLLKMMHLLGVVLFLGNILVTAVWKVLSDRQKDPQTTAFGQRLVTLTDFIFTLPGAILIYISGHLMAISWGGNWGQHWLAFGWSLFVASGFIWFFILIPIQIRQARLAKEFSATGQIPALYWKLSQAWAIFGTLATLLPFLNLYLMVFKPS